MMKPTPVGPLRSGGGYRTALLCLLTAVMMILPAVPGAAAAPDPDRPLGR